jgi:hypothetical protein
MTDTQHTPGPWFATPGNYAVYVKDAYGDQGDLVCALYGAGATSYECAANARLIAAAPELLEACRLFVAYDTDESGDDVALMLAYARARAEIRAAIAKATGE